MVCPRCGTANDGEARACARCWTPLTATESYGGAYPNSAIPAPQPPAVYGGRWNQAPYASPQPPGYYAQQSASTRAIVSLVLGILSLTTMGCLPLSVAAIVTGKLEMKAIERGEAPQAGQTLAKVGFVIGIISAVLSTIFVCFYLLIFGVAFVGGAAGG